MLGAGPPSGRRGAGSGGGAADRKDRSAAAFALGQRRLTERDHLCGNDHDMHEHTLAQE